MTSLLHSSTAIVSVKSTSFAPVLQLRKLKKFGQPFPELTALALDLQHLLSDVPVVPDSFLGGSAPRLRLLIFKDIPFPGLQKLLLSATHLVQLHLWDIIPHSGYISPEEMVTCLSVLTSLETLSLGFESPQSSPDQESGPYAPPPPTRSVLPTLRTFTFKGINEYLEELLARIDTPGLFRLWILFFDDIDFDTSQLIQFVGRTLTFKPFNEAHVTFRRTDSQFQLRSQESNLEMVRVDISCRETNWQLSTLAQICTSFSPHLSAAESLYIHEGFHSKPDWSDVENTEWLEVLFPFTAVKNLYISKKFGHVSPPLCKSSPRVEWQQCCPPFRIFSWRGSSHRNLSRKALGCSFLADSSPITLLPSLRGTDPRSTGSRPLEDDD